MSTATMHESAWHCCAFDLPVRSPSTGAVR